MGNPGLIVASPFVSRATVYPDDKQVLRELARRKAEVGRMPRQLTNAALWRALNDLQPTRPLIWINEVPWHELTAADPDALTPRCADPFLREVETGLRRELYQWNHFACDMVVEPILYCDIVGGPHGVYADYGICEQVTQQEGTHDVVYQPVIDSLADVEKICTPRVWFDQAETHRRLNLLSDLLGDVIEIRRRGFVHQWHTPWDQAIHWYGVERLMFDMIDRPELVAAVCQRVVDACSQVLDRQQELGMLDVGCGNYRVGSGGLGYSSALPAQAPGRKVTPRDQWGCGNAQVFSEVSPEMHEEFSLRFERPFIERFGLSYYGCCEPLHRKMGILKSISNLRKISMSPKADLAVAAQAVGDRYVLSFKPNPACMATDLFDVPAAEKYLRNALDATRGCHLEIILKDISTVRSDPVRLDQWARLAMALVGGEGT